MKFLSLFLLVCWHDDVTKCKHFPRYWPFVRGIHRSPVDSPHKRQWHGDLFSLICVWTNGWANNRNTGDLRRHHAHYDVTVMDSNHKVPLAVNKPIMMWIWFTTWYKISGNNRLLLNFSKITNENLNKIGEWLSNQSVIIGEPCFISSNSSLSKGSIEG